MTETTLIPSMTYGGTGKDHEFTQAAALLSTGPAIVGTLISHRYPLDAAAEAFDATDRLIWHLVKYFMNSAALRPLRPPRAGQGG